MVRRGEIQRIDRGRDFGDFGADARRFFRDETAQHIVPLCQHIRQHKNLDDVVEIADVGGGNGLLAKAILDALGEEYPLLIVDVLDIDESKFLVEERRIRYFVHDARQPFDKQYDASFARSMLHYNTPTEQKQIIEQIARGTKPNGLVTIVQPTPSRREKRKINGLYHLLCDMKGSNEKYWLTSDEITRIVDESGLQVQEIKFFDGVYTVKGFYKERYNLSEKEIERVYSYLAGQEGISLPTSVITAIKR